MNAHDQINQEALEKYPDTEMESWSSERDVFFRGGLKGMEIQKKIDRKEIERLKSALSWALSELEPLNDRTEQLEQIIQQLPMAKEVLKS